RLPEPAACTDQGIDARGRRRAARRDPRADARRRDARPACAAADAVRVHFRARQRAVPRVRGAAFGSGLGAGPQTRRIRRGASQRIGSATSRLTDCAGGLLAAYREAADSALEFLDQCDVLPLRVIGDRAFERLPGIPFGAPDEVGHARALAAGVALARLLGEGVELKQDRIVGAFGETLRVRDRLFELLAEIVHRIPPGCASIIASV